MLGDVDDERSDVVWLRTMVAFVDVGRCRMM